MSRSFEEILNLALALPEEQRLQLALELYEGLASNSESAGQEAGYDEWVREQVQTSLDDPSPDIPHDQVVREVRRAVKRAAELKRSA